MLRSPLYYLTPDRSDKSVHAESNVRFVVGDESATLAAPRALLAAACSVLYRFANWHGNHCGQSVN